ncbi:acyl-CoA dehydrogenase [Methyloferula stellata]|uniref:acyl-CoA dehydrogenase n=1 Tax=Methyloferula stellata TaxID=876270 RepID=UPI000360A517|nr:acyl-CoA dehydrogenase [Methyloferula stellata]
MIYHAPVAEILFAMLHEAGLDRGIEDGLYADLADGFAEATLTEAGRLAEHLLLPLDRIGDREGARLIGGQVRTPEGWPAAYAQWAQAGWNRVSGPLEHGGFGLPILLNAACIEIWTAANMAFGLCPLLTIGAIEALRVHGSPELQALYLPRLVAGTWTATMNLTEPQAGSDLSGLKTRAVPEADGSYRIFGSKIFITFGDHDMAENIVHLVLARLPDAPEGTRGISLFLVPKFLADADGSLGARNDLRCISLEHKLGIHGSPTCAMVFGEKEGARGWLIGEPHRGLACMFTMMNNARLNVGMQGVAIAERATQLALYHARERRQGRAPGEKSDAMSEIIRHPDVQRMLMTMKALVLAARAICLMTADSIDRSQREPDVEKRKKASERAGLLTPLAKAFSTDIGNEVASLGVQVHGGMGYIEDMGAAQLMRDVRIAAIYEGTNGIQAMDLVLRKLPLSGGEAMRAELADMREIIAALESINAEAFGAMPIRLGEAVASLERAVDFMRANLETRPKDILAGASPFLRLFGLARGGTALARGALSAHRLMSRGASDPLLAARIALARFFAENIATGASGLERNITEGAGSVHAAADAFAL